MRKTVNISLARFETHDSFEESVKDNPRREQLVIGVNQKVRDQYIEGCSYAWDSLTLLLSNKVLLTFQTEDNIASCSTRPGEALPAQPSIPPILDLHDSGTVIPWDWQNLLAAMLGKKIRAVTASKEWMFLFLPDAEFIFLPHIMNGASEANFLYFGPN